MKRITLFDLGAVMLLLAIPAWADSPKSESQNKTLIYFVRHGEDAPELVSFDPSFTVIFNNCTEDGTCCEEVLNPLGQTRATALADWFEDRHLANSILLSR